MKETQSGECPQGCGDTMVKERIDKVFSQESGEYFLVRNILVHRCQECGEIIFPAESAVRLENLREEQPTPEEKLTIPAYNMEKAS